MKYVFALAFIIFSLGVFSQSRKEIKVSKNKISESKTLHDFISDLPKECNVKHYIFSASISGSLKEFSCTGDGISPEMKSVILTKEKGQWFFIENIKLDCKQKTNLNYKITLD